MNNLTIQVPTSIAATPKIMTLIAALLEQKGVFIGSAEVITNKNFVSLREGAELAGVNYFTFRKWVIEQKKIPYTRPSGAGQGKVVVARGDIETLLAGTGKRTKKRSGREVSAI